MESKTARVVECLADGSRSGMIERRKSHRLVAVWTLARRRIRAADSGAVAGRIQCTELLDGLLRRVFVTKPFF